MKEKEHNAIRSMNPEVVDPRRQRRRLERVGRNPRKATCGALGVEHLLAKRKTEKTRDFKESFYSNHTR